MKYILKKIKQKRFLKNKKGKTDNIIRKVDIKQYTQVNRILTFYIREKDKKKTKKKNNENTFFK